MIAKWLTMQTPSSEASFGDELTVQRAFGRRTGVRGMGYLDVSDSE